MSVQFVAMDVRALDYVRSEMAASNWLGRLVASNVDLDEGRVVGVIPESHATDICNFRAGIFPSGRQPRGPIPGGYIEEVSSTETDVGAWVNNALASDRRRALVC